MGLTLHFSATLRDPSLHAPLTAEVADICRSMDWPYQLFNDTCDAPADAFPLEPGTVQNGQKTLHLNGILPFTPPECETVALIFTQSGRSCPPWHVDMAESLAQVRPDMVYNLHVKTQFAGRTRMSPSRFPCSNTCRAGILPTSKWWMRAITGNPRPGRAGPAVPRVLGAV